jgi:hypothetical protein
VWGTQLTPEQMEEMLRAYIDFEEAPDGELVCRLGHGKASDLTGVIRLMGQQFQRDNSFDTEFAHEAFIGLRSMHVFDTPVHAMPVNELMQKLHSIRHIVYYCTHCGGTEIPELVLLECPQCFATLAVPMSSSRVACQACFAPITREPYRVAENEQVDCATCGTDTLRPFNQELGGFVLDNGERTRTRSAGCGCCGFKHIFEIGPDGQPGVPILGKSNEYAGQNQEREREKKIMVQRQKIEKA